MKVVLDECCPRPLRNFLGEFEVYTVEQAGCKGLSNGKLLAAAEGRFDALITADKNLRYQQQLAGRKLAILELPTNSWKRLEPFGAEVASLLKALRPGEYRVAAFKNLAR